MKRLFLKATENTPEVIFSLDEFFFSIAGVSVPENPSKFFDPIIDWVNKEMKIPKLPHLKLVLIINIKYFSTSSAKYILKLVGVLNNVCKANGANLAVEWCYLEDDEDMKEAGELIQKLCSADFIYKPII